MNMVVKASQERVKALLKDTITLLCKNGLEFQNKFSIEAVIGVTLDDNEVFLISMNELIKSEKALEQGEGEEGNTEQYPDTTTIPPRRPKKHEDDRRLKRKKSRSPEHLPSVSVKREPQSPMHESQEEEGHDSKSHALWGAEGPPSLSPSAFDDDTSQRIQDNTGESAEQPSTKRHQKYHPHQRHHPDQEHSSDSLPQKYEVEQAESDSETDIVIIKEEASDSFFQFSQDAGSSNTSFADYSQDPQASMAYDTSFQGTSNIQWNQSAGRGMAGSFRGRGGMSGVMTSPRAGMSQQPGQSQGQQQVFGSSGEPSLYQCSVCGKSFSSKSYWKQHEGTHKGKFPYNCPLCHKGFSARNMLQGHMSWHTGIKEFKCQLCDKEFRYKHTLRIHNENNHSK